MKEALLALGLSLLAAPTWAGDEEALAQEVEWAALDGYSDADPAVLAPDLHAIFYQADPDTLVISVGGWWTRLTGPVEFSDGSKLDLSETLGLRARKFVPQVRAGWRLGWLELVFEGFWYDNGGTQVVATEFEIDDVVFEVGDLIDSDLKIHNYRLTVGATLTRKDWITFTFGVGLGALYTEGSIKALNVDKAATWEQWIPLPLIELSAKGYFIRYPWTYEANFGWIGFSSSAFGAAAVDARFAIGYEFSDWIYAKVGYRFYGIHAEVDQVEVDLDLSGFYFELAFTY